MSLKSYVDNPNEDRPLMFHFQDFEVTLSLKLYIRFTFISFLSYEQMVEAAGLMMNEKDVIEGKKDYLNFAYYFAKSLICKNEISFSLSEDRRSLHVHLSYDLGSYKAPGSLLVRGMYRLNAASFPSSRMN